MSSLSSSYRITASNPVPAPSTRTQAVLQSDPAHKGAAPDEPSPLSPPLSSPPLRSRVVVLLLFDLLVLLVPSTGTNGVALGGGGIEKVGLSVGLGLSLGESEGGEDANDVLPARDSREVAAAGVGRDSVLDLELKYSEAALASVVLTLNVVQVVERDEVTIDAWMSIE